MLREGYSVHFSNISNDTQLLVTCGSYLYSQTFHAINNCNKCIYDAGSLATPVLLIKVSDSTIKC